MCPLQVSTISLHRTPLPTLRPIVAGQCFQDRSGRDYVGTETVGPRLDGPPTVKITDLAKSTVHHPRFMDTASFNKVGLVLTGNIVRKG